MAGGRKTQALPSRFDPPSGAEPEPDLGPVFEVLPKILLGVLGVCVVAALGLVLRSGDDGGSALETEASPTTIDDAALDGSARDPGAPELADGAAEDVERRLLDLGAAVLTPSDPGTDDAVGNGDGSGTTSTSTGGADSAAAMTQGASSTTGSTTTTAVTTTQTAPPTTAVTTTGRATTTARPTTSTTNAPTTSGPTTTTTARPTTSTTNGPTTTVGPGRPCSGDGEFERVFRDDFDGNRVSSAWRQYHSIGNNGYGLRRPEAISVSNGTLFITAEMVDGELVSGGMAHNYDQRYGKYVFRVRTDNDPNLAMSGVVLTWPESQVHPRDGENNIYETLVFTAERTQFYSVIHKPFGQRGDQEYFIHRAPGNVYQTMTMEWTPDRITLIRQGDSPDDREVIVLDETAEDLIPDVAHHVTIQLDAWKHSMEGTVRMAVDFIEVWKYCD